VLLISFERQVGCSNVTPIRVLAAGWLGLRAGGVALEVHPYRRWPLASDSKPVYAICKCSSLALFAEK